LDAIVIPVLCVLVFGVVIWGSHLNTMRSKDPDADIGWQEWAWGGSTIAVIILWLLYIYYIYDRHGEPIFSDSSSDSGGSDSDSGSGSDPEFSPRYVELMMKRDDLKRQRRPRRNKKP